MLGLGGSTAPRPAAPDRAGTMLARVLCALTSLAVVLIGYPLIDHSALPTWRWGFLHIGPPELAQVLPPLLFIPVLPLVSYRRRDWLLLAFVPLWSWVVAWRVGWRLAILPRRDWPARPDERPRMALSDSALGGYILTKGVAQPPEPTPEAE